MVWKKKTVIIFLVIVCAALIIGGRIYSHFHNQNSTQTDQVQEAESSETATDYSEDAATAGSETVAE